MEAFWHCRWIGKDSECVSAATGLCLQLQSFICHFRNTGSVGRGGSRCVSCRLRSCLISHVVSRSCYLGMPTLALSISILPVNIAPSFLHIPLCFTTLAFTAILSKHYLSVAVLSFSSVDGAFPDPPRLMRRSALL